MIWHLYHCDVDYGTRVAQIAGLDLQKALKLEPLPGRPAPHQPRAHRFAGSNGSLRQPAGVGD